MKELSIIVPHKNSIDTLARLTNSIPWSNFLEIIIVDDHSDSEVKVALKNFCMNDDRITLLDNNTEIFSAGKARNIGLTHAKGKWILFADSDDYFLEDFCSQLKIYMHSEAEVIYFKPKIRLDKKGNGCYPMIKVFDIYQKKPSKENLLLLALHMITPWSKMIKREHIEQNDLYFDEVKKNNDVLFSQKLALCSDKIEVSYSPIYFYAIYPSSLTNQIDLESFYSVVDVHARAIKFLRTEIPRKLLLKVNPETFYLHYRLIFEAVKNYRSLNVVRTVIKIYQKNGLINSKYLTFSMAIIGFYKKKRLFRK